MAPVPKNASNCYPQRPNVESRRGIPHSDGLRWHVEDGSGGPLASCFSSRDGHTEISNIEIQHFLLLVARVVRVIENIGGFDVAVYYAMAMKIIECRRHLTHEPRKPVRLAHIWVRSVAEVILRKQVFEITPAKAEEHLEFSIGAKILEMVELGDVWLIEREWLVYLENIRESGSSSRKGVP